MKKFIYALAAIAGLGLAFRLLFFWYEPGFNHLIFVTAVVGLSGWIHAPVSKQKSVLPYLIAYWLVGLAVFVGFSELPVPYFWLSLPVVAGALAAPAASAPVKYVSGIASHISGPFRTLKHLMSGRNHTPRPLVLLQVWGIPVLIFLVFFFVYAGNNVAFSSKVGNLFSFEFVWDVAIFFFGCILLSGAILAKSFAPLNLADTSATDTMLAKETDASAVQITVKGASVAFILLNALLMVVNLLDLFHLSTGRPPEGYTYSEYLHQGVYAIIFSILMAMLVIVLYFRAEVSYYSKRKQLVRLAYLWVAQNAVAALFIIWKNTWYIQSYGLTYKRLGVFLFLLLALIGLVTVIFKIRDHRSFWFLIRRNVAAFYLVFLGLFFVNWDAVITRYNLYNAEVTDLDYLMELSGHLHILQAYQQNNPTALNPQQQERLTRKIEVFKTKQAEKHWLELTIFGYLQEKYLTKTDQVTP